MLKGFQFAGVAAGIKVKKNAKDIGLVMSTRPASCVGMFTTNQVVAAPVVVSKKHLSQSAGYIKALVINSGNANACTGATGLSDALSMAKLTAAQMGVATGQVMVCSTGKIGVAMPMKKIKSGIKKAYQNLDSKSFKDFAHSIMTTDQYEKICQVKRRLPSGLEFSMWGVAKGAGMIEPHMATMLSYVFTDLTINPKVMQPIFKEVVEQTFNSISVDGDTSTNDTVLWLASNMVGEKPIVDKKDLACIREVLLQVCAELARLIVADGEGATKVVELAVVGAVSKNSAKSIAYTISHSLLVKSALFGEDPNWGRILAAIGYSGETVKPNLVDIYIGSVPVVKKGMAYQAKQNERLAHRVMKNPSYRVTIDLKIGNGEAKVLTSDLTLDYVKLNSEYST